MADSLDDFFAKKDKKRRDKSKSSAISAVALVKELEEGAKQAEFQIRKEAKTSTALEILGLDSNDGDWKDFEEVERRDYSGLKVKEMSIQDQEEDNRRQIERAEQAPEPTPWKSKEATVAAITSAAIDPTIVLEQQLLADQGNEKKNSAPDVQENSSDKQEEKETEPIKNGDVTTEKDSDSQKPNPDEKSTGTTSDSTKSEGDTKKPETSAKTKYVPPHERNEANNLEPTRLKFLVRPGSGANLGKVGNLKDENEYPSLG